MAKKKNGGTEGAAGRESAFGGHGGQCAPARENANVGGAVGRGGVNAAPVADNHTVRVAAEQLVMMPLDQLVPYANNARVHDQKQIAQIRASLREFGFVTPLLVDFDGNIIAGHGRLEAARAEGLTEVTCVLVSSLTEAQRKAYILADNRLSETASWDAELLKIEIEGLQGLDFDAGLAGFDLVDLEELGVGVSQSDTPMADEDDYDGSVPESSPYKLGDVFQLGQHTLMCGDSTKLEDVEVLMGGCKADMAFTDPPWNVNYGAVKDGNAQGYKPRTILNDFMGTEDFKEFMSKAFASLNFAQKDGAMTYVVMSAQEWGNMMLTLAQNDYHWSSTIIWNKDSLVLSRKDYHTKYEPIWYGWKNGSRLCPLEDRKQSDVWDIHRPKKSDEHPTMKPVELVARAIQNSSKLGNSVVDLFGGSGTTLIACEQLGRRCFMMEMDPKYVAVIIDRWEKLTGEKAVQVCG